MKKIYFLSRFACLQNVCDAAQSFGYNFSRVQKPKNENEFYSLRYSDFEMPLDKAMQEQQQQIDALKSLRKK